VDAITTDEFEEKPPSQGTHATSSGVTTLSHLGHLEVPLETKRTPIVREAVGESENSFNGTDYALKRIQGQGRAAAHFAARWQETHARSLGKAVSWRATGSLDTFLVALVITGNAKVAGSVAVTEIITKILIYYFHERLWALVPWGKR
jgi:uncharacterized membrane protein